MLLHGYGATGAVQDGYFGTSEAVDEMQFVLVVPDGTADVRNAQFWNATPACCDFVRTGVDDVAYVRGLVAETRASHNIDSDRVYLVGHSNGGFMSYRMACDASDVITAIASLAGATFDTESECSPEEPVSVLQIHGTADSTILFDGDAIFGQGYPSATESVRRFAKIAGCDLDSPTMLPGIDILQSSGDDTEVLAYRDGCLDGIDAELWTMPDEGHVPPLSANFTPSVLDWLFSHSK